MTPDEKAELRKPVFISKKDGDKDLVLAWVSAKLTIGGVVHSIAQPGILTDGWYLDALIDCSPEEAAGLTEVSATMRHIAELRAENARLAMERDEARDWVRRITDNERLLTCVYCGQSYPPGTPTHNAELLEEHVNACAKHPVAKLRADNARLAAEIERLKTWTKCSERMPDMSQLVAAWCSDFVEPVAGIITPHHDTVSKRVLDTALGEGYGFEYFTHWMPLPELPKGDTDG